MRTLYKVDMARIHKLVHAWGSTTIGTTRTSLSQQSIKPLGDVVNWALYFDVTTVDGDATDDSDGGTPSGSWIGTNILRLLDTVRIKDNQNTDVWESTGVEFYYKSYLLSIIESDELLMNKGGIRRPHTDSTDLTASEDVFIVPQRIAFKDLPCTVDIKLGVLDDYWNSVGTGTVTVNQLELWVRYIPSAEESFTERVKSFNISSFSSDQDIAEHLPSSLEILKLAFLLGDPTASSAPATMVDTRLDFLTFKRGSSDEIDGVRNRVLQEYAGRLYPNLRIDGTTVLEGEPTGLFIVPTLAFVKTDATEFKFDINAAIAPHVIYVYK